MINCYLRENQSGFSDTSTEGFGEGKHSESIPEREPRSALGDIDYTSKDGCWHTKLTPE